MAANAQNRTSSSLPFIGLLVLMASAFYISTSPLKSSRPKAPSDLDSVLTERDTVEARLWQDPLKVALIHEKTDHGGGINQTDTESNSYPPEHRVSKLRDRISGIVQDAKDERLKDPNIGPACREKPTVHVLLTIVRDGTFAEDHERRLRNRYAMLSALHLSDFSAEDSIHIQYFKLPWPEDSELERNIRDKKIPKIDKNASDENYGSLIVPYEWFLREKLYPIIKTENEQKSDQDNRYDRHDRYVVIIWLPESAFSHKPLIRLAQIIDAVGHKTNADVRFDVIGPSYSGTLRTMINEIDEIHELREQAANEEAGHEKKCVVDVELMLNDLTIFSPWSTASPALLVRDLKDVKFDKKLEFGGLYGIIPKKFEKIKVKFIRTIGSDDLLTKTLIEELNRRGLKLVKNKGRVELISEWDTFYGQTFPLTFATMLECMKKVDSKGNLDWVEYAKKLHDKMAVRGSFEGPNNICTYSYIRGVDGQLPGKEPAREEKSADPEKSESKWAYSTNLELPIGTGRLDYVRRLAQDIAEEHRHLLTGSANGRTAIGVVGSDVYDKLIILHALRERFNNAIFFLTDLDARLLHNDQIKWTRNSIVVSNFDLTLGENYQCRAHQGNKPRYKKPNSTPPFRDNYQTALFFACRIAMGLEKHQVDKNNVRIKLRDNPEEIKRMIKSPRIFEIGRGCAVNMSMDNLEIHPKRQMLVSFKDFFKVIGWIILAIICGILFLLQVSSTMREIVFAPKSQQRAVTNPGSVDKDKNKLEKPPKTKPAWHVRMIKNTALFIVLFVVLVGVDHYQAGGEPFSLRKGTSIWPGEILRLAVIILSVYFLAKSLKDLKDNEDKLRTDFKLERQQNNSNRQTGTLWKRFKSQWRGLFCLKWTTRDTINAQKLWSEYLDLGDKRDRFYRSIMMGVAYMGVCGIMMYIFGTPMSPYRGSISWVVNWVLLILSVLSMVFVMLFVVDATHLCLRFIQKLRGKTTEWPAPVISYFETNQNKAPDGLAEWLDIKLIASHTEVVGRMIYYPFILLLIMIASRNTLFDNWDFPVSLIIVLLLYFLQPLICAIILRREAEKARRESLHRLQKDLLKEIASDQKQFVKQIEEMIADIKSIRQGAFSSFMENPVVHIVFTSGGMGLLTLLRFVTTS